MNLNEYIIQILAENIIFGELSPEENRAILLRYFKEYQFDNKDEVDRFLYAFCGKKNIESFNEYYNLYAMVDDNNVIRIYDDVNYHRVVRPFHSLLGDEFFGNDGLKGFNF